MRSANAVKFNHLARIGGYALAALALSVAFAASARAQEEEGALVVLDEPVVQVNNDVIMLSSLRRQMRDFKDVLVTKQGMTEQQAEAELAKRQPEIIYNLITEQLLLQKGKDVPGLPERVEAEVNREMLRVCKAQNLNTLENCEEAMRGEGLSPDEIRQTLRAQFMKQAVLQQEVDSKVYFGFTDADLHKYYDAHRDKFQSVTLSEIFFSTAGRKPEDVRAKAAAVVAQARSGVDFGQLAAANSEREIDGELVAKKTQGRLEGPDGKPRWFLVSELIEASPKVGEAVKPLKAGQVSDPVQMDEGFIVFKVHERDDAFNENQVRGQMLQERGEKDRAEYVATLRKEAYIKPADAYKDALQPLLDKDRPVSSSSKQSDEKKPKDKKNQKQ